MVKTTLLLSLFSGLALSAPASNHVLHERRALTHARWTKAARLHPRSVLPMRIGLTQTNVDSAEEYIKGVSDPYSETYGQHWSADEVIEAFKPSEQTTKAVYQWLVEHGISPERIQRSGNKQWLGFDASRDEVESLLKTEFHEYHDSHTGSVQAACEEYSVPAHIQPHIDYVTPGIKLLAPPSPVRKDKIEKRGMLQHNDKVEAAAPSPTPLPNATDLSTCDQQITPACIRALYSIPERKTPPQKGNSLGIFESQNQYYYQPDLNDFFKRYAPNIPAGTHPIPVSIDGGYAGSAASAADAGGEANLDVQLAYPIVYPQTLTLFADDDSYYGAWPNDTYKFGFNTFLDAVDGSYCDFSAYGETGDAPIDPQYPDPNPGGYKGQLQCGTAKITNVVSFSYGGQEVFLPANYQKRQCLEYLKLGLQGTSFIFASGDSGVGDYPNPYGMTSDTGCIGPKENIFNPTWPVNCPWVTSVGATKVYPGHSVLGPNPESAVYDPAGHPYSVNFSSGGGFSNVYQPAYYQQPAIDQYFALHTPEYPSYSEITDNTSSIGYTGPSSQGGIYNRIGRGIPDVAAVGDNIALYNGGEFELSGGTSASTPIFASIINRINDERLAVGKKPVGFINPVLYANPGAFRDITNGSNPDCNTKGFSAVQGWDPVTGLGTPNYEKLLQIFMALP